MERNEAIGRLRLLYSSTNAENKAALECLIPELMASEDERIREGLYRLVTILAPKVVNMNGITKEEALTYLEKQKEQNLLPGFDEMTPEERMNHPLYLEGFDCGRKVGEVLAEQNPAEWSEEDERMLENIHESLYAYQCDIRAGERYETYKKLIDKVDEEKEWLKSLCNRFTWKPSEEHFQALRRAIIKADEGSDAKRDLQALYNDLKAL